MPSDIGFDKHNEAKYKPYNGSQKMLPKRCCILSLIRARRLQPQQERKLSKVSNTPCLSHALFETSENLKNCVSLPVELQHLAP